MIKLHLFHNDFEHIIRLEFDSCIIWKFNREDTNEVKNLEGRYDFKELQYSGNYIYRNKSNNCVYVGEATKRQNNKGVLVRILEDHKSNKLQEQNFNWDVCYLITSGNTNNYSEDSKIDFIEYSLYNYFINENKCNWDMINKNMPGSGNLSSSSKYEMSEYFNNYIVKSLHLLHAFDVVKKSYKEQTNKISNNFNNDNIT